MRFRLSSARCQVFVTCSRCSEQVSQGPVVTVTDNSCRKC